MDALKPRRIYCTGSVQQNQSTGGQTSRLEVSQELCAHTVYRDQSTDMPVSRLDIFSRVLAVDWGSNQSIGQVPGAACMSRCTGAVDCCASAVDWGTTRELWQSTIYTVSRLVTPRLKPSVDWCFGPVDWSTGSGFWNGFTGGF